MGLSPSIALKTELCKQNFIDGDISGPVHFVLFVLCSTLISKSFLFQPLASSLCEFLPFK